MIANVSTSTSMKRTETALLSERLADWVMSFSLMMTSTIGRN